MRPVLYSEIAKEKCNAKALGAYTASLRGLGGGDPYDLNVADFKHRESFLSVTGNGSLNEKDVITDGVSLAKIRSELEPNQSLSLFSREKNKHKLSTLSDRKELFEKLSNASETIVLRKNRAKIDVIDWYKYKDIVNNHNKK